MWFYYGALAIGVVANAMANILMKVASARLTRGEDLMQTLLSVVSNVPLIAGIACFVLALGGYMIALTRLPLTVAYPIMTGLGLVIVAGVSSAHFNELITLPRLVGMLLVFVGTALLCRSMY